MEQASLFLIVGTGIYLTVRMGFFQFRHMGYWLKHTCGRIFTDQEVSREGEGTISQFQSVCTALASTLGTGNIVGVAAAVIMGGPGAIFWMWIVSFLGMMTSFTENVLGILYRRKNEKGVWQGGPMYYLQDGVGKITGFRTFGRVLAKLFAFFCLLASFCMGNMSQVNAISGNMKAAFHWPPILTGGLLILVTAAVIRGGRERIARVTERLVPFMAIAYIGGTLAICIAHADRIGEAFRMIFEGAFCGKAAGGGLLGAGFQKAAVQGMTRGVFSNEAGLGSGVMAHGDANVKDPIQQGMWGIFNVFVDSIIICTLTALALLCSGAAEQWEPGSGADGTVLMGRAFQTVFGEGGVIFVAAAVLLFAFSTIIGWSYYGIKAWTYLFGARCFTIYLGVFLACILPGAVWSLDRVFAFADFCNGMMAVPNLIGVLLLAPEAIGRLRKYEGTFVDDFH